MEYHHNYIEIDNNSTFDPILNCEVHLSLKFLIEWENAPYFSFVKYLIT